MRLLTCLYGGLIFILFSSLMIEFSGHAQAQETEEVSRDYVVYSVYQAINMSNDPKDAPPKDYYINMGKQQGVHQGSILEVRRRVSTYDLVSEQLYRDLTVPVALVKVIHVEAVAAIARLQKLLPLQSTPMVAPRAILVGDLVRFSEEKPSRRRTHARITPKPPTVTVLVSQSEHPAR